MSDAYQSPWSVNLRAVAHERYGFAFAYSTQIRLNCPMEGVYLVYLGQAQKPAYVTSKMAEALEWAYDHWNFLVS